MISLSLFSVSRCFNYSAVLHYAPHMKRSRDHRTTDRERGDGREIRGSIQLDIEDSIEYSIKFYSVSHSTANSIEKSIEFSISN